ncbi:tRNA (adenosine(37)-N6)-threonylcarbamoyltransferase complex dimerization subunit type 1 TsaB [Cellulomonas edaphi]|uniref:tRNA (Adenosine(37)-N6)-threonylcarbamoyltransferase complex dimerization subunit type 1 TsaB n=1 Tax=Cellulomonas edaphi TaxID=3053468 RepID=A0ABT7S914_9CELL|nr:tRNA (adenosine(37)-N6)-threonylcarbamoyltransferase complex dimerization subunit type 1 TsaB [Cellulomons edaphi]MDM7832112.1 tRNA (adenosine(37)-N6)-threonylcarbamoyltransferase complex dimerization subunit type 1 TsaB [Cellulomons edaphi]
MPVLALDTSGAVAVALTSDSGEVLASRSESQQRHHAELLAPMITAVLADAGVDRRDLTAIVAGTGPAPFTGLRVGLVTARTLALGLAIPVLGVPSLDAIAAAASRTAPVGATILVATDARRREVYWSSYRADGPGEVSVLAGPTVGAAAAVTVEPGAIVVGRGVALYPADLGDAPVPDGLLDPDPAELARLALARRELGQALPTEPLYLRRPDAVPSAGSKRVGG